MENLNDIKNELKQIQENFNPTKSTYRIIDKVINDNMSIDQMLKSLYSIKGIEKYPEDIKEKYFEIVESLQKLLVVQRKREKQEQENKKTKELIASIEEREVKDKKEEPFKKEPAPEKIKRNLVKLQEKSIKEAKENLSKKEELKKEEKKEDVKQGDAKDKKIFKILIVMIAISIILGVLLILFL